MKTYKKVLTIAGSDSGGGAGIQADLKTISSLGCYGTSVITAITVQNTLGVTGIHPIPPEIVRKQLDAVLGDIGTDSVKIGMLHSAEIIKTVAKALKKFRLKKIVLDPVMVATSGDKLIEDNTVDALTGNLFPMAEIITPNIPEAEILTGKKIINRDDMIDSALKLLDYGSRSVLLKGGHLNGETLFDIYIHRDMKDDIKIFSNKLISTNNVHGTGCTLSSAIASFMAHGNKTADAVGKAIIYLQGAIQHGKDYRTGHGNGPVNHFYKPQKLN
jgi:hydroxymethylpyrimidine/phosphomethylpyrimidine kinase